MTIRIVGLGGSLTGVSTTCLSLKFALSAAAAYGAEITLLDLAELQLPFYIPGDANEHGPRDETVSASVHRLIDAVAGADGLIWAAPVYHGGMSGSFKNALDWLQLLYTHEPPYLTGKPVALIANGIGRSAAVQTINAMSEIARAFDAWSLPLTAAVGNAPDAFDTDGQPIDPETADRLRMVGEAIVDAAILFKR